VAAMMDFDRWLVYEPAVITFPFSSSIVKIICTNSLYYELAVKNINLVLFKLGVKMISVVVE
jgi:hypothetical protein